MPTREDQERFEVVFVCTGNRARSPLAQALLTRAAEGLPVTVRSFGTLDVPAQRMLHEAELEAVRLGLDVSGHRSRSLAGVDLSSADLVLGFERSHLAAAVVDARARRERTYTLPELVELVETVEPPALDDPVARARETVRRAHDARRGDPVIHEVADPIGAPAAVHRRTAEELRDLVIRLRVGLFGDG